MQRANCLLPDPARPGNLHDVLFPQRARIERLIERALETENRDLAHELIVLLDMADAPFEDREEEPDHEAEHDGCPCDDVAGEPELGWLNPWGEVPLSYREPARSAAGYAIDADGDMAGGCVEEVRHG
jgi:hypothetical protein